LVNIFTFSFGTLFNKYITYQVFFSMSNKPNKNYSVKYDLRRKSMGCQILKEIIEYCMWNDFFFMKIRSLNNKSSKYEHN